MVVEAMKYLDEIHDKDEKVKLIGTLRTVSDGKVSPPPFLCCCCCVLVLLLHWVWRVRYTSKLNVHV
jgi:hypothetical protein